MKAELVESYRRFVDACDDWHTDAARLVVERACERTGLCPTEGMRVDAERELRDATLDAAFERERVLCELERGSP